MKLRYMSDLHLEYKHQAELDLEPDPEAVLILAGDINTTARVDWIIKQSYRFKTVIYVPGNHEYYGSEIYKIESEIRRAFWYYPNIYFLSDESIYLNGIRFHGSTLWTDFNTGDPLTFITARRHINNYERIYTTSGGVHDKRKLTPRDTYVQHCRALEYLKTTVRKGDIVVTHMAPHPLSIHPRFKDDYHMQGSFVSDLTDLILKTEPAYWFHGHVHDAFDYKVGTTRILCNPRGYTHYGEGSVFDPNAFVMV